jgi:hypothetical protein
MTGLDFDWSNSNTVILFNLTKGLKKKSTLGPISALEPSAFSRVSAPTSETRTLEFNFT